MEKYYSIGKISKIYNISKDTLRYYEKIGLLIPYKKKETGYRYYSTEQIWKINNIRHLRELGIGLDTIKIFLKQRSVASTENILDLQLSVVEKELIKLKQLKKDILLKKNNLKFFRKNIIFETPILQTIDRRKIIKLKGKVKNDGDIDFRIKLLSVKTNSENDFLFAENEVGAIISFQNFMDEKYCVYDEIFIINNKGTKVGEWIEKKLYISLYFKGDYSQNIKYYKKIKTFIKQNNLIVIGNIFEIFHIDIHTTERIEEYITEIQIPVKFKR